MLEAVAAGKIPGIESLITGKIAIEDVVEKGFLALVNGKDAHGMFVHCVRVLLEQLLTSRSSRSKNSCAPLSSILFANDYP